MASQHAMDMLTTMEQALASIPLPPSRDRLPGGAQPVQWEELEGTPSVAPADTGGEIAGASRGETLALRIELGRARLCRTEAEKLRKGSVVLLESATRHPVDLFAGGELIARGEVLTLDGKLAVRVTERLHQTT
jgi:flagellar motor switch/type III secretory pathway protein FliN